MTGLEVYKIGREAIITLQPSTGYVAVSCGWHSELNGCHWWTSRGPASLHYFLRGLERSYAMGKLFDRKQLEEYDEDSTKAELKRWVIDERRSGSLSAEAARDIFDNVVSAESTEQIANLDGIAHPYEFIQTKPTQCADWFWNEVWAAFIDHLKTLRTPGLQLAEDLQDA
jgi:hypothetical protein